MFRREAEGRASRISPWRKLAERKKRQVEYRAVSELIPYARNSRTHSEEQVGQIAASIREFGWTNPLLIDEDGTVIAGHGRLLAAQKLGALPPR